MTWFWWLALPVATLIVGWRWRYYVLHNAESTAYCDQTRESYRAMSEPTSPQVVMKKQLINVHLFNAVLSLLYFDKHVCAHGPASPMSGQRDTYCPKCGGRPCS